MYFPVDWINRSGILSPLPCLLGGSAYFPRNPSPPFREEILLTCSSLCALGVRGPLPRLDRMLRRAKVDSIGGKLLSPRKNRRHSMNPANCSELQPKGHEGSCSQGRLKWPSSEARAKVTMFSTEGHGCCGSTFWDACGCSSHRSSALNMKPVFVLPAVCLHKSWDICWCSCFCFPWEAQQAIDYFGIIFSLGKGTLVEAAEKDGAPATPRA